MAPKKDPLGQERRQYIRLDSVFPVQFRILSLDGKQEFSDWLQGFTNNISKGGICLSVNNLKPELVNLVKGRQVKLALNIEIPLAINPASASAKVTWVKDIATQPDKHLIGLSYEEIASSANSRLIRYAITKRLFAPVVFTIIFILGLGFAAGSYINLKLIKGNKVLVEQLVNILQESSVAKQTIKQINKEREDLQLKIQALELRMQTVEDEKGALSEKIRLEEKAKLEEKVKFKESETAKKIGEFNSLLEQLTREKAILQEQLIAVQHKENKVTEDLLRLDQKKATLEKANLDKMYQWLKVHQNPHTGLVMSFEGDNDMANLGFTYDQSLVAQAYTNFSDFERARRMLDFFAKKAKRQGRSFYNAYYVNDGNPAEAIVHSGPNIWLGIAILQYTQKSQDHNYLKTAEEIASDIMDLQNQDSEGGLRGGPNATWYATEHNLDAYAFFNMLYKITAKKRYLDARDKILAWLTKHTYDKADIPIKRGKGDSTIATDTYAWSIAAIGPEKLEELGMNPGMIVEFAEKNCGVEVSYQRPEGQTVKVKGFDFAPQRHLARGGVVSSEWTGQMVIAFKIMADFYYKKDMVAKARSYALKADDYLNQLGNMIISSPSPSGQGESCLPYATQDFVDTGHGWMTPKGESTGSVAGTVYALFAYYNYNPLELKQ
ncbi:MAG: PilZ domain-containing protein [Candidatus Omnitrophica bacterium]|nr:PilZ domain-containing protein [Candidatus Omnitrophota bacterium]MDD5592543.1 PilZ domain-containing protein [Candidatus Omnitrophota bacterium]